MYRTIEHFALGCRRLFGEDHNIRSGWLTVGKGLSSSNFDAKVQGSSHSAPGPRISSTESIRIKAGAILLQTGLHMWLCASYGLTNGDYLISRLMLVDQTEPRDRMGFGLGFVGIDGGAGGFRRSRSEGFWFRQSFSIIPWVIH